MKKVKLFFKKLFMKKINLVSSIAPDGSNSCQIWEVEKDCESLPHSLGMFDDRTEELYQICVQAMKDATNIVSVMVICSKECKHANELYFCAIITNKLKEQMERPPSSMILEMLMGMRKNKD